MSSSRRDTATGRCPGPVRQDWVSAGFGRDPAPAVLGGEDLALFPPNTEILRRFTALAVGAREERGSPKEPGHRRMTWRVFFSGKMQML
jgi:hypothetical protein